MKILNKVFCPLCNSSNYKLLYEVKSTEAASHYFMLNKQKKEVLKQKIEKLWGQKKCYFLTCLNCTFCYAFPFIAGDDKYYTIVYCDANYGNIWKYEFEYTYKDLERLIKSKVLKENFMILEIGAGNGLFLDKIAKSFTNSKNIHCTEFSESSISLLNNKGINCHGIDIFGIRTILPEMKFDIICMFQVLEHLQDPHSVFKELNLLLIHNGFLYISVPNALQRSFFDSLDYHEDIPPSHVSRWNKANLTTISKRYGFMLLTFDIENTSFFLKLRKYYNVILKNRNINSIENKILRRFFKTIDLLISLFKILFHLKSLNELNNKNLGVSSIAVFKKVGD